MAGTLSEDTLSAIVDVNGTNFYEAAKGAGYGGESMRAMLEGTKMQHDKVAKFVELHIEQVL
jgi:hypothetical protein